MHFQPDLHLLHAMDVCSYYEVNITHVCLTTYAKSWPDKLSYIFVFSFQTKVYPQDEPLNERIEFKHIY